MKITFPKQEEIKVKRGEKINLNSTDIIILNSSFKGFSQMAKSRLGGLALSL